MGSKFFSFRLDPFSEKACVQESNRLVQNVVCLVRNSRTAVKPQGYKTFSTQLSMKFSLQNNSWHFHIHLPRFFHAKLCFTGKNLQL